MLMNAFKKWLRDYTLRTNRLRGLYRRVCQPSGCEWAELIRRHGGLYSMGERCSINSNTTITDPDMTRLGNNVQLTGCSIFAHDGSIAMIKRGWNVAIDNVGKVDIRDNVFIGHQSIIMPGVTIGPNAIVAAGSVVTRDVPPNTIVAGVPAKPIGTLDAYIAKLQAKLQTLPWRDHPHMAANWTGPADAELQRMRIAYFFGDEKTPSPQAKAE